MKSHPNTSYRTQRIKLYILVIIKILLGKYYSWSKISWKTKFLLRVFRHFKKQIASNWNRYSKNIFLSLVNLREVKQRFIQLVTLITNMGKRWCTSLELTKWQIMPTNGVQTVWLGPLWKFYKNASHVIQFWFNLH